MANQKIKDDLVAIYEIISFEPILKRGALGLLVAIFVDALEALADNKRRFDVALALEFINEDNDLFVALSHELDIEPLFLKKKVLASL
jgi:hypothetical protein